jgi:hypothetical protein
MGRVKGDWKKSTMEQWHAFVTTMAIEPKGGLCSSAGSLPKMDDI